MYKSLRVCSVLLLTTLSNWSQAATITQFTNNLAGWTAAAGTPVVNEDFSDTTLVPGLSITGGSITGGTLSGAGMPTIFLGTAQNTSTTLLFSPGTTAFLGDFDLSPGGPGAGLGFRLTFGDATTQDIYSAILNPTGSAFIGLFGFTSSVAFTSLSWFGNNFTGNSELFTLDNARFVSSQGGGGVDGGGGGTTQVPEPGTLGMLVAGLIGIALMRRLRAA